MVGDSIAVPFTTSLHPCLENGDDQIRLSGDWRSFADITLAAALRCEHLDICRPKTHSLYTDMALSGRDPLLRCCRSAFKQASKDARIFYSSRQLSIAARPSQLSPRSAPIPRFAPFAKDILPLQNNRAFSASSRQAVKAIINPRKNENGEDMTIDILPRAVNVNSHI